MHRSAHAGWEGPAGRHLAFPGPELRQAFDVVFTNKENKQGWSGATSWGVSTRLMGALIMTHSDDVVRKSGASPEAGPGPGGRGAHRQERGAAQRPARLRGPVPRPCVHAASA